MINKTIYGFNRHEKAERVRRSARAIVIKDGKLLLSRFDDTNMYMLPGGGLEDGETIEECCVREVEEETGYICKPIDSKVTVEEYYEEMCYVGQYFICELVGTGSQKLTEREIKHKSSVQWLDLDEALKMFASYKDYAYDWEIEATYLREHTGLTHSL